MVVNYNGLWKMLIDNKIKKKDLYSELNIGIGTIAKTGKGELVSLEILIKIYYAFEYKDKNIPHYKVNVEVKSRNSTNNMNVTRIESKNGWLKKEMYIDFN